MLSFKAPPPISILIPDEKDSSDFSPAEGGGETLDVVLMKDSY
jgi:hypothetical protein